MKLIIADSRMPDQAKHRLSELGKVMWFETSGITYPAISGHPDIFFAQVENSLVVAPNLPESYIRILENENIPFLKGKSPVGKAYPETAYYNALADNQFIIHNPKLTDPVLDRLACELTKVNVRQGYCRCNCLSLNGEAYISSDESITKALQSLGKKVCNVQPESILLPGFPFGFIGGTAGVIESTVVVNGNLSTFNEGEKMKKFILNADFQIVELHDGPLTDVGGIIFL
jgi:hypothetical protein